MKVVDAHTGATMKVGDTVHTPAGQQMTLVGVKPGLLSASVLLRFSPCRRAFCSDCGGPNAEIGASPVGVQEVPLTVRWLHPSFPLQHVGFIPS